MRLESDRSVAQFRAEAGLEPKAKPYGGWESPAQPDKTWSLAGHTLRHYLSAASLMYRMTVSIGLILARYDDSLCVRPNRGEGRASSYANRLPVRGQVHFPMRVAATDPCSLFLLNNLRLCVFQHLASA